jgi:deazaflavin-dependent oxidoreductase (nitroreductase family)
VSDPNAPIIEEFRANAGKVGGYFEGATMLLLLTRGVRTGQPRTKPLVYLPDGDRLVVFGTNGGSPQEPFWVRNVLVDPAPAIEIGADTGGTVTVPVRVSQIAGPERDELYARQVERRPGFAEYPKKTSRVFPAIALERLD